MKISAYISRNYFELLPSISIATHEHGFLVNISWIALNIDIDI